MGIRVRSQFPRFSEYYTVILEFQGKDPPSEFVKGTWSVGQFFDVNGFFDEEGLVIEIEELYQRFETGKFDKPDDESKKKKMTTSWLCLVSWLIPHQIFPTCF